MASGRAPKGQQHDMPTHRKIIISTASSNTRPAFVLITRQKQDQVVCRHRTTGGVNVLVIMSSNTRVYALQIIKIDLTENRPEVIYR